MEWFDAVLLGVLQGLTEFLPVSSSGHLVIARSLLGGFNAPGVLFEVSAHAGTLAAVFVVFRADVARLLRALAPGGDADARRLIALILAATVPAGLVGVLFKDAIHELFNSAHLAALMLLVTGAMLWIADVAGRAHVEMGRMGFARAVGVGVAQALALVPGISRSGSTIAAGKLLGMRGMDAARFSFLISIPAILGAVVLEGAGATGIEAGALGVCLAGAGAAFVSGLLALKLLLLVVRSNNFKYFALYCWIVGLSVIVLAP